MRRLGLGGGLAAVAFGLPALILWGYSHLMDSDYFALTYVDVQGLVHLEEEELLETAGTLAGEHILNVSADRLEMTIASLGFVSDVEVQRRFPDRLHITIEEHQPVAIVVDDGFWLANDDGEVFYELTEADDAAGLWELPLVSGLSRAELEDEQRRGRLEGALEAYEQYRAMNLHEKQAVSEIHVDDLLGVSLIVGETGTEVRLGQGRWEQRLEQFAAVQASLIRRGVDAAYVLVDHENDLSRVAVGQRSKPTDGDERTAPNAASGLQ